jgi:multidrug resistance efflux pump
MPVSDIEVASRQGVVASARREMPAARPRIRVLPVLITLVMLALAGAAAWGAWRLYMASPWTRDGTVRAYVVTIAPEVAGRIVDLPVKDNQFVHKGDLLMVIDPTNYVIAVSLAEATVTQSKADADNALEESDRRQQLNDLSATVEEKQTYRSKAIQTQAIYQQAVANLNQAQTNLERTHIHSPVNGYITNLLGQVGDYATVGQSKLSLVDTDSFWVDGYFEEGALTDIQDGDPARIKLMGHRQVLLGHVGSVARGINVANAQPDAAGLASVNPIFTWVRLAQRVPVRIEIDQVPAGVRLVQGLTATVELEPKAP